MYLLIKVGYGGIEKLAYLSDNIEIIKNMRIKSIEIDYAKNQYRYRKKFKDLRNTKEEIADQYCVLKWDENKFDCCCKELGIETSEMILY
jgi:hypothetical protein